MATNSKTGRIQTFYPKIESTIPRDVQRHLQLIYSKLNNHTLSFQFVKKTTENITKSVSVVSGNSGGGSTTAGVTSFNTLTGDVTYFPYLAIVNNRTGVATYTTQVTDNGGLLILNNAAGVAVTLNNAVPIPWFVLIDNTSSAGAVTLTPASGTINGNASATIPAPGWAQIYFDGTNYEAQISATLIVVPITFTPVAGEYLTGYDAATGLFSAATIPTVPSFADNETPAGLVNGSNPTFTLANAPNPPASLNWYDNGIHYTQGIDFTLAGNTVTTAIPPPSGHVIRAFYRF